MRTWWMRAFQHTTASAPSGGTNHSERIEVDSLGGKECGIGSCGGSPTTRGCCWGALPCLPRFLAGQWQSLTPDVTCATTCITRVQGFVWKPSIAGCCEAWKYEFLRITCKLLVHFWGPVCGMHTQWPLFYIMQAFHSHFLNSFSRTI